MERVQEFSFARKGPFSERFVTVLPCFLSLLESEWHHSRRFMNEEEQGLVRQAHAAIGRLAELEDIP
ncbi:MAG TPA: hypothetical protein VGQ08_13260 [Nitrospiraceae bacterium]|jgi:hypothetical protein|nr:hypothetical protein [Nitrospiraceae bacterium]